MEHAKRSKLSRADRREQLLDTARRIIAEHGADALTMGVVAEKAGVSKPIVYDHFGTRPGLLIALYQQVDTQQVASLKQAVASAPALLADVAHVVARAYMGCSAGVGTEWYAISAALKGDEGMNAVQQALIDDYLALYCEVFAPFSTLEPDVLMLRCVGILGAAEALSEHMVLGRANEAGAVETLTRIIVGSLN